MTGSVREFLAVYREALRTEYEERGPEAMVFVAFFFPLLWYAFKDLQEEYRPTP